MIDRGLRRAVRSGGRARGPRLSAASPGAEHAAEASGDRRDLRDRCRRSRSTRSTARDFDDAISAAAQDDGSRRVWVHIADVSAYVRPGSLLDREAYRRGTSVYVPGAVEPMLPDGALEQRLLARARAGSARGHGRDRARRRPRSQQRLLPLGDPLRRAARLRPRRPDLRRAESRAAEPWGPALEVARGGGGRARGAARVAGRRSRSSPPSRSSRSTAGATSCPAEPVAQTESHRLIEHLMIAANEQVAQLLDLPARADAVSGPRAPRRDRRRAPDRPARRRSVCRRPPVPEGHLTPQQAAEVIGQASRLIEEWTASHGGRGRAGLTSLVLRSLKQAYYDQRNLGHAGLQLAALLPFHLADPPLPRSDLPPRAAVGGRRRRAGAGGVLGGGGRTVDFGARARGDDDRARRRRHRGVLPARAVVERRRPGPAVRGRGGRA